MWDNVRHRWDNVRHKWDMEWDMPGTCGTMSDTGGTCQTQVRRYQYGEGGEGFRVQDGVRNMSRKGAGGGKKFG